MDEIPVRREHSLTLKLHEAKGLQSDLTHNCDPYAIISLDHKEQARTRTIWNTKEPVWDQDFLFDVEENFSLATIVVWDENRKNKDIPIGKITLSKAFLAQGKGGKEQWVQLASAETEGTVTGEIELEISYFPPSHTSPRHTINVYVANAKNLIPKDSNGLSDPYIVFHLIPDPETTTTKCTRILHKTLNPDYKETFSFLLDLEVDIEQLSLHASVWDWDRFSDDEFMGHLTIPLSQLPELKTITKSYPLLPSPASIKMPGTVEVVEGKLLSIIKLKHKRQSRKASFHQKGVFAPDISKGKTFLKSFQSLPLDDSTRIDKPRGSVRLHYHFKEEKVLPLEEYTSLIQVITNEKFLAAFLLGKFSNNREEAATSLITFFDHQGRAKEFICAVIDQEVSATADPNTLFRGNSMASKSLDVYMKLTAMPYLQKVLAPVVKEIISFKKSCELDPTRLEKGEDLNKNLKNLISLCELAVNAIFQSAPECPKKLCEIYHFVKSRVKQQYPDNEFVEYTSVSGYIFLRFFCPAILGPTLFNIWQDAIDKTQARHLTLVAKVVQNLGNLVEFGYKEPFMNVLNPFIMEKMPDLKKFIEEISTDDPSKGSMKYTRNITNQNFDSSKECARLHRHFDESIGKILENCSDSERPLAENLKEILDKITSIHTAIEDKIKRKKAQDRANRMSRVSELINGEGKVSLKFIPTPSSLSDPPITQEEVKKQESAYFRPNETFDTNEEAIEAMLKGVPTRESPRESQTPSPQNLSSFPRAPRELERTRSRPSSAFTPPTKQSNDTASNSDSEPKKERPQSENVTITAPPKEQQQEEKVVVEKDKQTTPDIPQQDTKIPSTKEPERTSIRALDELDNLLSGLSEVALTEPTQNIESGTNSSQEPPKSDVEALDDLMSGFTDAANDVVIKNLSSNACLYCESEVTEDTFHTWAGFKWHSNHFKCTVCETNLEGSKFFFHNHKLFCVKDYLDTFTCAACGERIEDQVAEAMGKKYHFSCFCCSICQAPITDVFRVDDEGNLLCKEDWLIQNGMICSICQDLIPGDYVTIDNNHYHPTCLICYECKENLTGRSYVTVDGNLFCSSHFLCHTCKQPITSQLVTAMNKRFHAHHFNCTACKKSLIGEPFYDKGDKPYCGPCSNLI